MTHALTDGSDAVTDDEVAAAVVALIVARAAAAPAPADESPALWRDRTALLRAPAMPGRDAWRASGRPV